MEIQNCQQIFEQMQARFNPEAAGDWKATIAFRISGEKGGDWVLDVHDGQCQVRPGTTENPTATVTTSDETFIGIVTGKTNPMMAYTLGKVKVKGSMGDVMKLNNADIFPRA